MYAQISTTDLRRNWMKLDTKIFFSDIEFKHEVDIVWYHDNGW
jgi:hypothetical protein